MKPLFAVIFIVAASDVTGQVRIVAGKVVGSEFRTRKTDAAYEFWNLAYAKIFWQDAVIGTTDSLGRFRIELPDIVDVIKIGAIGMYPETIRISEKCDYLEIILLPDAIYDFVTLKKEEKLRKKDRSILPELYQKAFERGVLKQAIPCR